MSDDTKPEYWKQKEESDYGTIVEITTSSKDSGTDSFSYTEEIIITKVE